MQAATVLANRLVKVSSALMLATGLAAGVCSVAFVAEPVQQAQAAKAKPAKVKGVEAGIKGEGIVKLTWNKAKNAKTYKVRYSLKKSMTGAKSVKVKGNAAKKCTVTVSKLKELKTYYIQVKGVNGSKNGKWSKKTKVIVPSYASMPTDSGYFIAYHANGGYLDAGDKAFYTPKTATFDLPVPARTGCIFGGWYTNSDFSGQAVSSIEQGSKGNIELYAKWSIDFSKVKVDTTDKTYTGSKIEPAVSVGGLTAGKSYKVIYSDNENVGTATITVQGKGAVTGSMTYSFDILQREAQLDWDDGAIEYNGKSQVIGCKVANAAEDDEVAVNVEGAGVDAGPYVATAVSLSNPNYKIPAEGYTKAFTIAPRIAKLSWSNTKLTYNCSTQAPQCAVANVVDGDEVTVTVKGEQLFANTEDMPYYTATAAELSNPNYALPAEGEEGLTQTFTVAQAEAVLEWDDAAVWTYDGKEHHASCTVANAGWSDRFTIEYSGASSQAGTHSVTVTSLGNSNYKLPASGTKYSYTILPREVTVSGITCSNKGYDGTTIAYLTYGYVDFKGILDSDKGKLSVEATGVYDSPARAENKTVYISNIVLTGEAKDNYKLASGGQQSTTTASIDKKTLFINWDSETTSKQLISDVAGTFYVDCPTFTVEGLAAGEGVEVKIEKISSITRASAAGKGTYTVYLEVTGDDADNYSHVIFNGTKTFESFETTTAA